MRILYLLLKIVLFLLLLGFAAKNTDVVAVRYFFGYEWQAPLVFVLLVFFALGIAIGLVTSLSMVVAQRREIAGLKREMRNRVRAVTPPAADSA